MLSCLMCGDNAKSALLSETVQKFVEQLGNTGPGISMEMILCHDCLSGIVKATEWREQLDAAERTIPNMTLQTQYLEEMRRLQEKIQSSEDNTNVWTAISSIPEADAFRQGILKVVVDLIDFQNGLSSQPGRNGSPFPVERPFKCHLCPKAFRGKGHLKNHLLTHSDEKPFICPVCKKGFARKDYLQQHVRIHTVDRRFQCPVCGQKLSSKQWLKNHLKRMHSRTLDDAKLCN